jgi:hypothetical protein
MMSDIYAMRRANGDWFALEASGRLRVPVFHSSRDAMMARSRNGGMFHFKAVALNAKSLEEIMPAAANRKSDFCMVSDPLVSLSRGELIGDAELILLMNKPVERAAAAGNEHGASGPGALPQGEWWN